MPAFSCAFLLQGRLSAGHADISTWTPGLKDVIANPVVLTRQALGGVVPEPDGVAAILSLILGGAMSVLFGMAALSFHLAARRLLKPGGR